MDSNRVWIMPLFENLIIHSTTFEYWIQIVVRVINCRLACIHIFCLFKNVVLYRNYWIKSIYFYKWKVFISYQACDPLNNRFDVIPLLNHAPSQPNDIFKKKFNWSFNIEYIKNLIIKNRRKKNWLAIETYLALNATKCA